MGPHFVTSYPALAILAFTLAISVAQSVAARILYGIGELRTFARLTIVEAAVNLVLTLALLPIAGIEGVALAVTIPNMIGCILIIRLVLRRLRISLADYGKACTRPLVAIVVPTAIWLLLGTPDATWLAIGRCIACGLVPYVIVVAAWEFLPCRSHSRVESSIASATMPTCQPSLPST
jgi:O-antigen/teichoic acid export membrane protein